MPGIHWDDLRVLLALENEGSLAGAARALKVDGSTVSRRLAALESALGAQLVARTPDGAKLNAAGADVATVARRIDALVRDMEAKVAGADETPRGVVRVSVTDGLAPLIYEGLAETRKQHPELQVEVVVSPERVDLARGDADVALRLFREASGDLVVRKIATIGWSLYASDAYIASRGAPRAEDLASHDIVGYEGAAARSPGAKWLEAHAPSARVVVRGRTVNAVLEALRAGMGASVVPCFVARGDASVRRVLPEVVAETEVFLVVASARKELARVRVVLDALERICRAHAETLSGVATAAK